MDHPAGFVVLQADMGRGGLLPVSLPGSDGSFCVGGEGHFPVEFPDGSEIFDEVFCEEDVGVFEVEKVRLLLFGAIDQDGPGHEAFIPGLGREGSGDVGGGGSAKEGHLGAWDFDRLILAITAFLLD